jgi:hypothetical protein
MPRLNTLVGKKPRSHLHVRDMRSGRLERDVRRVDVELRWWCACTQRGSNGATVARESFDGCQSLCACPNIPLAQPIPLSPADKKGAQAAHDRVLVCQEVVGSKNKVGASVLFRRVVNGSKQCESAQAPQPTPNPLFSRKSPQNSLTN